MNEPAESLKGKTVVTADGVELGEVDTETASHLRVHSRERDVPEEHIWVPRSMVAAVEGRRIELTSRRADLHDAVLALSPGEQREYASLNPTVRIGRERWISRGTFQ